MSPARSTPSLSFVSAHPSLHELRASTPSLSFVSAHPSLHELRASTPSLLFVSAHPSLHELRASTPSLLFVSAQEGVDERLRFERREIVCTLTEPDQFDRNAELALYRDDNTALCRAVQLRQYDAGHVAHLSEHPGLLEAVLASRRVQHEKGFVDRPVTLHDALDLAELIHEPDLVLQPAGGIDQHRVDARVDGAPYRVERHRRRVSALLATHHL